MPGHMNVLLAEADIPYTDLVEMDEINPDMPQADVALVVGANDVVNPAARTDKTSPIYGMPIIDADKARTVFAIKRSKNPGFAGHRQRAVLLGQDADAVRRRQGRRRRAGEAAFRRGRAPLRFGVDGSPCVDGFFRPREVPICPESQATELHTIPL